MTSYLGESLTSGPQADYLRILWDDLTRGRDSYTHHYDRLDVKRLRSTVERSCGISSRS